MRRSCQPVFCLCPEPKGSLQTQFLETRSWERTYFCRSICTSRSFFANEVCVTLDSSVVCTSARPLRKNRRPSLSQIFVRKSGDCKQVMCTSQSPITFFATSPSASKYATRTCVTLQSYAKKLGRVDCEMKSLAFTVQIDQPL